MLGSHNLGDAQASLSGSDGTTSQGKRRRTGRRRRRRHGVASACASPQAQKTLCARPWVRPRRARRRTGLERRSKGDHNGEVRIWSGCRDRRRRFRRGDGRARVDDAWAQRGAARGAGSVGWPDLHGRPRRAPDGARWHVGASRAAERVGRDQPLRDGNRGLPGSWKGCGRRSCPAAGSWTCPTTTSRGRSRRSTSSVRPAPSCSRSRTRTRGVRTRRATAISRCASTWRPCRSRRSCVTGWRRCAARSRSARSISPPRPRCSGLTRWPGGSTPR